MSFHLLRPALLVLVIPALALTWWLKRHRDAHGSWAKVINPHFLPFLMAQPSSKREAHFLWFALSAWIVCVFALSGPTFSKMPVPMMQRVQAAVLVLNLSKSMDAQDISPSRLERAKLKIRDLLALRKDGQTALVVYAGDVHVVTPLSSDVATIESLLAAITTNVMPVAGDDPVVAIKKAMELLKPVNGKEILLITDSLSKEQAVQIKTLLAGGAYRLSVMGVGTEQGGPILDEAGSFVKDERGQVYMSKANLALLRQLAKDTRGNWLSVTSSDQELATVFVHQALDKSNAAAERFFDEWHDVGYWFALLLVPAALLLFRRGYLFVLVFFLFNTQVFAAGWKDWFLNDNQQAFEQYQSKEYSKAAENFSDSLWKGTAFFQDKNYSKAEEAWRSDGDADAAYNLGNALALQGKIDEAIKAYEKSLQLDANNKDAVFNKELLEKLKQEQEKQEQEKQEQKDSQNDQQQDQKDQSKESEQQKSQDQKKEQQDQNKESEQQKSQEQQDQQKQEQQSDAQKNSDNRDQQQKDEQAAEQQEKNQQEQQEKQQQAQSEQKSEQKPEKKGAQVERPLDAADAEKQMALEQMMRRIPDDPGGLLRRKFLIESRRAQQGGN